MKYDKIIQDVVNKLNIKLVDVTRDPVYIENSKFDREYYINQAFLVGDDEVVLGIFRSPDLRLIAFFHEIGHRILFKKKTFLAKTMKQPEAFSEWEAWRQGILYAIDNYDIKFTNKALAYALESTRSYVKIRKTK